MYKRQTLLALWHVDANIHTNTLAVIGEHNISAVRGLGLNGGDRVNAISQDQSQGFVVSSTSQNEWQGVLAGLTVESNLGLIYLRDGLFPVKNFNSGIDVMAPNGQMFNGLGEANAYLLPLVDPYETPVIDEFNEKGLFLWKDDNGIWHLKQTAGTETVRISGRIISSQALTGIQAIGLEQDDNVDITDLSQIVFDLSSVAGETDEIIFTFPDITSLSISLDNPSDTALLYIGGQRWPVNNNPVDVGSWSQLNLNN